MNLSQIWAIVKKDVVSELRTKEMVVSMFLFVMLAMVIFNYAFGAEKNDLTPYAGGLLWTAFLFMSMLGLNRSFVHEKDEGCLDGLLLSPVDRSTILLGKMLGNLIFLIIVQVLAVPVFAVFFIEVNFLGRLGQFILSILLSDIGISAVGTLLATISINSKMRDMLLPIIFLPVSIPLVIAAVISTSGALAGAGSPDELQQISSAMKFLVAYDIIFLLVAYALYDFVVGE
ncbi:MAG: heme exporter protein CcmB [Actinobacteria bacterium]|nr:heme exporter protein CcmB [Actinomycetota bacterium]